MSRRSAAHLFACALLVAFTLVHDPAEAAPMMSDDGSFTVDFPTVPTSATDKVDTKSGPVLIYSMTSQTPSALFMTSYNDYPPGHVKGGDTDGFYRVTYEGAAKTVHGTVRSAAPFRSGDVVGRDCIIDVPDQGLSQHVRYFLVRDRLYQVLVVGPLGTETEMGTLAFLDSFRMLR